MYILFLISVTMVLVATAAFFSVVGIASMFAYNYVPALVMGIALEAGKIGVAVYLYRYWFLIPRLFKTILITFLAVLMFITSVGIFGYLSQGYQKTSEEYKLITQELKALEAEAKVKRAREQEINRQIEELPVGQVRDKIRLSREFADEQAELRDRLAVVEPRLQELGRKQLAFESHIGPISYVARMMDVEQDRLVFWAIMLLVLVADPLAVTLTVACNMALIRFVGRRRSKSPVLADAPQGIADALVERARVMALVSTHGTFDPQPRVRRKPLLQRMRARLQSKPKSGHPRPSALASVRSASSQTGHPGPAHLASVRSAKRRPAKTKNARRR
jgi:cell division protein FtsB